jgi:hypothetical protein
MTLDAMVASVRVDELPARKRDGKSVPRLVVHDGIDEVSS